MKQFNQNWSRGSAEVQTVKDLEESYNNVIDDICARKGIEPEDLPDFTQFNEDMYYVLVEKTSGEAGAKVKSAEAGQGMMAYHRIYWWFVKTSGIALQDRARKVTFP